MLIDNEKFTRIRYTQSTNADNETTVTEDSRTTFDDGSIQPITEEDIEKLESHGRTDYKQKLITGAELRGPDAHTSEPADRVEWNDQLWDIEEIEGGYDALIQHNAYALIRTQE